MAEHAEVFISATTRDLGSYRREIKNALLTLQIFPIEESTFTLAYGPLTEMLRNLIGRCDAVIHLAGLSYGAEPQQRPPDQPRRSYTQLEYDVARELRKPIYLFLATEGCTFDTRPEEGEEERALQLTHWQAIEQCGDIYYSFSTQDELRSRVRELRFPAQRAEAPRRIFNLPYASLGPLFKGRDGVLADLRQRLRGSPYQAICGLGGVGKTRLVIEYAWHQASDYTALLFVSARSGVELRTNLAGLCEPLVLNLPEWNRPEEAARLATVLRWLSTNPGWLLILDHADTPDAATEVEKILPQFRGGNVLVTSRLADWSPVIQTTGPLEELDEVDAAAFLLERTKSKRRETPDDNQAAARLARDLGGFALALEQAGAYVAKNRLSFSEYHQRWKSRKAEVLAWHDARLMAYPSSLATTWQTAMEQVGTVERQLLSLLAWLAPEPVLISALEVECMDGTNQGRYTAAGLASWSLARWTVESHALTLPRISEFEGEWMEEGRAAAAGLASWSLARWTTDGDALTVHRLVQEMTRHGMSEQEKTASLESALAQIAVSLPDPAWSEAGWRLWERLAPHVRVLLQHVEGPSAEAIAVRRKTEEVIAFIMNQYGLWLHLRGQYTEAEPFYKRALKMWEQAFSFWAPGTAPEPVAQTLNSLAGLYHDQGQYAQAAPLYERALSIRERTLGPEHPHVATSLNNLAELRRDQGQCAQAAALFERALAIRERALGPEHSDVAYSLDNLARLHCDQGQYAQAAPLFERALAIREKTLGPEHPDVAYSLSNLAERYRDQGRYEEAEALFKRALKIHEQALGPEHPTVTHSLTNLASLYRDQDRYEEAEALHRQSLDVLEKALGPDHPNVARCLEIYARLLRATGRPEEATSFEARARAIRTKHAHQIGLSG